jgi:hypothetical protein
MHPLAFTGAMAAKMNCYVHLELRQEVPMNKTFYALVFTMTLLACQMSYSMVAKQNFLISKFSYLSLESDGGMGGGFTYLQVRENGEIVEVVTSGKDASMTVKSGRASEDSIAAIDAAAMEMLKPAPKRQKICPPPVPDVGITRLKIYLLGHSHTWTTQGDICTVVESERWGGMFNAIMAAKKDVLHSVTY